MKPVSEETILSVTSAAKRVAARKGMSLEGMFLLLLLRVGMPPGDLIRTDLEGYMSPGSFGGLSDTAMSKQVSDLLARIEYRRLFEQVICELFAPAKLDIPDIRLAFLHWCIERRHEYGE